MTFEETGCLEVPIGIKVLKVRDNLFYLSLYKKVPLLYFHTYVVKDKRFDSLSKLIKFVNNYKFNIPVHITQFDIDEKKLEEKLKNENN